jgi:hypothetical protein
MEVSAEKIISLKIANKKISLPFLREKKFFLSFIEIVICIKKFSFFL